MMMIVHTNLLLIGAKCVANDLNITHINKQTDATIHHPQYDNRNKGTNLRHLVLLFISCLKIQTNFDSDFQSIVTEDYRTL